MGHHHGCFHRHANVVPSSLVGLECEVFGIGPRVLKGAHITRVYRNVLPIDHLGSHLISRATILGTRQTSNLVLVILTGLLLFVLLGR